MAVSFSDAGQEFVMRDECKSGIRKRGKENPKSDHVLIRFILYIFTYLFRRASFVAMTTTFV